MATKRTRRARFQTPAVDPEHWRFLTDQIEPRQSESFAQFDFEPEILWPKWRDRIMSEWLEEKPGTRPHYWWVFDAPRLQPVPERYQGRHFSTTLIEHRHLLSGEGRPAWEKLAITPGYRWGIPSCWIGGDPAVLEFESQYDYLERHSLLEPGETRPAVEPTFIPLGYSAA